MSATIKDLQPTSIWENFYKLTQVPRPSNHEEKARIFMLNWAKENNINAQMDDAGNIIMSKPATPRMENRQGMILQCHLDMVPQKNEDTQHDFNTDPIQAYIDGEWVRAKGTTLGADNGIGVATAMAVLTSTDIPHGPIEVLITATEETGMDGANGLRSGMLKGDILLNLDSETEGELYVGCAGGLNSTTEFLYKEESVPAETKAFRLAVKGLKGGHSGIDINLGRGNSNKILFRFLKTYSEKIGIRIASISGGSLRNAIPRESFAIITIPASHESSLLNAVKDAEAVYKAEIIEKDPDLQLLLTPAPMPTFLIDECVQWRVTNTVLGYPNGAIRMIDSMPDTVETSNNVAIINMENGKISIITLMRSSVDSAKDALAQNIEAIAELAKADTIKFDGAYPGWKPNPDSVILKEMQKIYNNLYGKRPAIMAIHAGLECGILGAGYPNWDMISFGPTICHPHSPDEKVNIASVEKFWNFLKATLKDAPIK